MFDDYIKYVNTINKYIVEDIEIQLSNDLAEKQRNNLERQKEALINDNYVKRLEKILINLLSPMQMYFMLQKLYLILLNLIH